MEKNEKSVAFTILELLIVLAVVAISCGLSLASYNRFTQERQFQNAISKLQTVLQFAITSTHSGDSTFCRGTLPKVVFVSVFLQDAKTYILKPTCSSGTAQNYSFTLEGDIVFNSYDFSVDFSPITYERGSESCIVLKSNTLNSCHAVYVNSISKISKIACTSCGTCTCN